MTGSALDVSWSPIIPPGHTQFSWEDEGGSCAAEVPTESTAAPAAQATSTTAKADKPKVVKSVTSSQEEGKLAAGPSEDAAAAFRPLVKAWMELETKAAGSWHKSQLLVLTGDNLRWNKEETRSITEVPTPEAELFAKEVEYCLRMRCATMSQGVHDRYISHCVHRKSTQGQVASGKSLYLHGLTLLHGLNGVRMDKEAALIFLHQAAEQGIVQAISLLGYCYEFADGVGASDTRAVVCYKASAALGDPHGMVRLGRCLWEGVTGCCEQDRPKAESLVDEGISMLRTSLPSLSLPEMSRALSVLHTQMNFL